MNASYWPHQDDEEILRISDSVPCDAEVSCSSGCSSVDLVVTDHFGHKFVRLNVPTSKTVPGRDWCSVT